MSTRKTTSKKLGNAEDVPADLKPALVDWLLAAADDVFLLGHRNSDWTGLAPMLEEDLAFSSIAQDEIAHAQAYYGLVAELTGESSDQIAYGRGSDAYRCAHLVERVDDFDWARAIVRQFYYDHYDELRLRRAVCSAYEPLAGLAKKIAQEERFHVQHADRWIVRLGTGTGESKQRLQRAVDQLWPDGVALFEPVENEQRLAETGILPPAATEPHLAWAETVIGMIRSAGLTPPAEPGSVDFAPTVPGGRRGIRSDTFGELLEELSEVYRVEPGAQW